MRRIVSGIRIAIAALAILASQTAVAASEEKKQNYASMPDKELMEFFDKSLKAPQPDYCNQLVPIIEELGKRRVNNAKLPYFRAYASFQCAYMERRWKDAYSLLPALEQESGQTIPDSRRYVLAVLADEHIAAAKNIIRMAEKAENSELGALDIQLFFQLSRALHKAGNHELRAKLMRALVDSPHWPKMDVELRSSIAEAVIKIDAEQGIHTRASELANELQGPYPFKSLLADRQLQAVWPQLERAVGPNMRLASEQYVSITEARYRAAPLDRKAFQRVAHALLFAGRFEDAIALARTYDHSPKGFAKLTEDDAWALNIEAYALDALGRSAEAETVFEQIAAIPYEKGRNGWLVSFVINRSSRLVELGKWQQGLDAAGLARKISWEFGSPYARMLVRQAEVCALYGLERGAEATKLLDEIYVEREEAYGIATQAFLCAGADDKAAAIALEALKKPDAMDTIAGEFQKSEFQLFYTRSQLPNVREKLLGRPEISEAFLKIARDIPDDLIPLAGMRRAKIAMER